MLTLDKKTVTEFESEGIQKLKVFFYEAGCSGTKINMETDFEVTSDLVKLPTPTPPSQEGVTAATSPLSGGDREGGGYKFDLYVPKTDKEFLENASITRVVKADHT